MSLLSRLPAAGVVALALAACPAPTPSVTLTLLEPAAGQVGASIKARLTVSGPVLQAGIRVYREGQPDVEVASASCFETCEQTFTPPSGRYEVLGFLAPNVVGEGGALVPELQTPRHTVELEVRTVRAVLVSSTPKLIKALFLTAVLPESVDATTVKVRREVQASTTGGVETTPVDVTPSLSGRMLSLAGDFPSPARYLVDLDGVRDAPGNRCVQTLAAARPFFENGPDLRTASGQDRDLLALDGQGRLHHLEAGQLSRWVGGEWTTVATWTPLMEEWRALDAAGLPLVAQHVLTEVLDPNLGTTFTQREVRVRRFDGAAWVDLGGALATTRNQLMQSALRVDGQGRPVLLTGTGDLGHGLAALELRRWNGAAWDLVWAHPNPGLVTGGALGTWAGRPVLQWSEGLGAQPTDVVRLLDGDTLTPLDPGPGQPRVLAESLVTAPSGEGFALGIGQGPYPDTVLRRDASGWTSLGGPGMRLTSLSVDPSGHAAVFGVSYAQQGSTVVDPGDPFSGSVANVYVTMSGHRHDGAGWGPLPGATQVVLEAQQAPWMSGAPAEASLGDATFVVGAAWEPGGALWALKVRGFIDPTNTARTRLLRARHAP